MVVDDDNDILKFCDTLLAARGYESVTCSSALRAIELLRSHPVDLIVVDIVMPIMDGFDLLKELKRMPQFRAPILVLTGRNATEDVRRAISLGALDYMIKPFDKDVFLAKVESLIGRASRSSLHGPEATHHSEVQFAGGSTHAAASVIIPCIVSSVSEVGLVLRSKTYLDRNLKIKIQSPVFSEIGIEPPFLRTSLCRSINDAEYDYEIAVSFIGLDEIAMRKIRRWITARAIAKRKIA